ncbi:Acyltransferase family protein [Trichomonas vaginalis G3]|uniref:Acyltransferase family protein n=1 Tax=Trichomonas vaginalis (strain ATCC PRA-98 / G3) TaxID=412133 RepID=A2DPZ7_TRIV3|nr:1-alkylglycerophosphocholine O-acetyltransferase protein [Trichomonas vaginalis G3]EAY17593.1 Acyltransferase family protein [Trichomonas vaginalis G3]KAI5520637.1 1-alkylglycerophosphocholine O-acetyltransferase protein [Trichomonas vaginalis G3]|eukprot:XP_001329728.1 Acyltransferase family protein [Trichomonas vaginalis G3]
MGFSDCVPHSNDQLKHQTSLSTVTDEQFHAAYAEPTFTAGQRFVQLLLFIFGLGWLRFLLLFVLVFLYMIIMTPCHVFYKIPWALKILEPYGTYASQKFIRAAAFLFGIWYISVEGKPDFDARAFVFNHLSLLDGLLTFIFRPFTIIAMSGIRSIPCLGQIAEANGAAFIDRSKSQGNSAVIRSVMEDHTKYPASIAPEGKISNGYIVFRFRTGSFLTDEPIQPITIRYSWIFAFGGVTYNWVVDTFLEWLWLALCIPFGHIHITFLKTIPSSEFAGKTPQEKADMCQLLIANNLGTLAIDRSAKEIFQKPVVIDSPLLETETQES